MHTEFEVYTVALEQGFSRVFSSPSVRFDHFFIFISNPCCACQRDEGAGAKFEKGAKAKFEKGAGAKFEKSLTEALLLPKPGAM
jgi:hypothetical protein